MNICNTQIKQEDLMKLDFDMKQILKYLSASNFFTDYAKSVKNVKHKMRGIDGNGKPIEFTEEDKKQIKAGIKQLSSDLQKQL